MSEQAAAPTCARIPGPLRERERERERDQIRTTTTTVISLYLAGIPEGESAERVLPISQRARMHFTRAENEGEQKRGPLRISDGGGVRIGITIGQLI